MTSWNNYLWPLIALQSEDKKNIAAGYFCTGLVLYTGLWNDDDCCGYRNLADCIDFLSDAEAVCSRYDRFRQKADDR